MTGLERARQLIAEEGVKKTGVLDLGNLGLATLPEELFELTHLHWLNLGSWYSDESGTFQHSANASTGLGRNTLDVISPRISRLQRLRTLFVNSARIAALDFLHGLNELERLACYAASISSLAPLAQTPALVWLDCSHSSISDLQPLKYVPHLRFLDCSNNKKITDLGSLQYVPGLRSLRCSATAITALDELRYLPALEQLVCSRTNVVDLNPLRHVSGLQLLDCSDTFVANLPLQHVPLLQSLFCWSTRIDELTALSHVGGLRALFCEVTRVTFLPLEHVPALQMLDCSETRLKDLWAVRHVPDLRRLSCRGTMIADLKPIGHVPKLEDLSFDSTPIADLTAVQHLPQLTSLSCSDTKIVDLSPLRHLSKLQFVQLASTNVTDLSPLRSCRELQVVDCSYTAVHDLTPLLSLERLEMVNADGCSLTELPESLVRKPTLDALCLYDVRIPGLPAEVLSEHSSSSCLEQLRSHLDDLVAGSTQVRQAKLMVIGNGRVGKTQICRRLQNLPYDATISSTHGITVTSEPWHRTADIETLNIWDFGGQDIYHGAHTLFMRTRAIFLVVWDPDFESGDDEQDPGVPSHNYPLSYWLDYVCRFARNDSPVIVVQTRCERPEDEAHRLPVGDADLARFQSLKPCWYSAKTNRGRGALDDALADAVATLREREGVTTIGAGRMRVMKRLEAWRDEDARRDRAERIHRTLTQDEFRALCEQEGGVSSPENLLDYLHNAGVLFHRPSLFRDRIILDQTWALEAVYTVFDRARSVTQIRGQGGRFTRSFLDLLVWSDYQEPEQRLFLSLMESCAICFVSRPADAHLNLETEYITPDFLPGRAAVASQLEGRWDDGQETWRLEYEYAFLHHGLMRTLICDIGAQAKDSGVYWKFGAWVYERGTGCRALLEQHRQDDRRGTITLKIQGRDHQYLARWLRERIEARNGQFGHRDLAPSVDELRDSSLSLEPRAKGRSPIGRAGTTSTDVTEIADQTAITSEPAPPQFEKPPASFFPTRAKEVFISYAWGDATEAGKQRSQIVDDLCGALQKAGVEVRRDSSSMRPGDRISEFMDRLADSDRIVVVLSDKYLRSEYCMYELFRIYRSCADNPQRFLSRIIPLVLPDADIGNVGKRLVRAKYWKAERDALIPVIKDNLDAVGGEVFKKYRMIDEFARNTSDMLEYLVDKLEPRDFSDRRGFDAIVAQIGGEPKQP